MRNDMSNVTDSIKEFKKERAGKKSDVVTVRTEDLVLPKILTKDDVKNVRKILDLSQSKFGKLLDVSTVTVQKWENNTNKVSGPARLLMQLLLRHPAELPEEILSFN
jgi:DNA-binding transcriptional regulator YiaG